MPCQTATRCLATPAAGPDLAGPFEDPAIMLSSSYRQDSPQLWRAASCSGARLGESGPRTTASCRPVPQTPTVLSEHMVWQRRPVCGLVGPARPKLSTTTSRSNNAGIPHCALYSYLAARSSRPLPQHRSKLMCATYTETLIRRVPYKPCFGRSSSLLACLKASRRSLNWQSIRDIPDVRDVFLERHTSEVGVLRAFRSVVLRSARLTLKQTLDDHRIPPIHARRLRLASWRSSAFSSNHFGRER